MAGFTPPLAALTTIFTPPCPTTWLLTTTKVPSQFPPFPTTASLLCDPPSWDTYIANRGFHYYSPAICPFGFTVGPECIITNPRTAQGFPTIRDGETAAYCVPSGQTCTSDTSDFRGGVWGVRRAAGHEATVGPAIQIRWRDQDLSLLKANPLAPDSSITVAPSPYVTATETEPSSTTSTSTDSTVSHTKRPQQTTSSIGGRSSRTTSTSSDLDVSSSSTQDTGVGTRTTLPPISISPSPTEQTISQPQPSTTPSTTKDASAEDGSDDDDNGSGTSRFLVAATVLLAILMAIVMLYGFLYYRRSRVSKAGMFSLFERPFLRLPSRSDNGKSRSLSVWPWLKDRKKQREREAESRNEKRRYPSTDTELGTEGPLPELAGRHALGTKENPAELPVPERWSWMRGMSKIFTTRSK
ncbi:hypothetical protein GGS20DRAFT_264193 [Poronia punctata]|nr:hypothetical protein GGS20DRAFT_264193 [Poronia punctata]